MIGPTIPEHLLKKTQESESNSDEETSPPVSSEAPVGPAIPDSVLENRRKEKSEDKTDSEEPEKTDNTETNADTDDDAEAYAPALPPDLLVERQKTVIEETNTGRRRAPIGPSLPTEPYEELKNNYDDDIVGPVMPTEYDTEEAALLSAKADIEERARKSKELMENGSGESVKLTRPEWMLTPPTIDFTHTATSTKARAFSGRTLDADKLDTSIWTDSPADRERKQREKLENNRKRKQPERGPISEKEIETRRNVERYNSNERSMSLMEMHKKSKASRPVKEDPTSRPFDREKDLVGTRPMKKKQKEELLKLSGELGTKFGNRGGSFL